MGKNAIQGTQHPGGLAISLVIPAVSLVNIAERRALAIPLRRSLALSRALL